MTTFSTWQLDIFNSWINAGQSNRGGLQDVSRNFHITCQAHLFVFFFFSFLMVWGFQPLHYHCLWLL